MSTLLIHGGPIYTPFDAIEDGAVLVRDGRIERVGPRSEVRGPADAEIDAGGRIICPGFVDLQVNGGGGALLVEQPEPAALERIARAHLRFGTTSLLAAVTSAEDTTMLRALAVVSQATRGPTPGARILGAHLEGPFLNPERAGAHDPRFLQPPRREHFERFLAAAGGSLRLLTLAPELPGAPELIDLAREASVTVSLGHSDATYEQAKAAIEAGASAGTHIFNAMCGLHHRDPGVVGALLEDERAVAMLIADGVHVHPALLRLVARAKGAEGTALVSDALPPVGGDGSSFEVGGRTVTVRDGACYLEDGTLVGSALSLNRAVALMHRRAGVSLLEAIEMATATPARVLGLQDEVGVLQPGARADIVVCDAELNPWRVFLGGELA